MTEQDFPGNEELTQSSAKIPELMKAYRTGKLPQSIVFPEVEILARRVEQLESQQAEFMASNSAPISPLRRSSDALEELLDLQGQFTRVTPTFDSGSGPRFGEGNDAESSNAWALGIERVRTGGRVQELPFAATDEETAELNKLLRGELRWVAIKKGKAGRQSPEQFASRVDPLWR